MAEERLLESKALKILGVAAFLVVICAALRWGSRSGERAGPSRPRRNHDALLAAATAPKAPVDDRESTPKRGGSDHHRRHDPPRRSPPPTGSSFSGSMSRPAGTDSGDPKNHRSEPP